MILICKVSACSLLLQTHANYNGKSTSWHLLQLQTSGVLPSLPIWLYNQTSTLCLPTSLLGFSALLCLFFFFLIITCFFRRGLPSLLTWWKSFFLMIILIFKWNIGPRMQISSATFLRICRPNQRNRCWFNSVKKKWYRRTNLETTIF